MWHRELSAKNQSNKHERSIWNQMLSILHSSSLASFPTNWDFLLLAVVEREQSESWIKILSQIIVQKKSTATEGNVSVATKIRMLYAGKDLWTAKDRSLLVHTQYSDLLYHSFKQIFSPSSGHLFILLAVQNARTQRLLFILCATEMKSWGREKRRNPCPKFPFKSEVWKDIKQSTQCYVARKSVLQARRPRPSAVAQSRPHPPWTIRKTQGEWALLGEMEFLIVLPCDYHEHRWTQLLPFSE